MLENPSRQKELFPKYEVLQRQAGALLQELTSLRGLLHGPFPQTTSLNHNCKEHYHSLSCGTRNLQIRDPTLSLAFESVSSSASQFKQLCLDCLHDLEHKKHSIQTSYLNQQRQLYVLFYRDPTLLAKILERLERRVKELHTD